MYFQYIKALHIIFIVTWFSGLFYIVRLFVYYAEAGLLASPEKEILQNQYKLMQKRLWYGITWPSAVLTAFLGTQLLVLYGTVPLWLWVKLGFVLVLFAYHGYCQVIFNQQQKELDVYSATFLRFWNEIATILLVGIVFLVVLKSTISLAWGLLGLFVFTVLLVVSIRIYRYIRINR